ncbi:hypothetical protein NECID01_0609 [Nematocida sp. AWRm77]|nr:hypothetical protein NECID01_0609 [Nematocida sp. AWRm77]
MREKEQNRNIPHTVLFAGGLLASLAVGVQESTQTQKSSLGQVYISPYIYAFVCLVLLGLLYLTKKNTLTLYHKMSGGLLACGMGGIAASMLDTHKSPIVEGFRIISTHYACLYFLCGLVLSLRFLPVLSSIAQEIGPNSHMDLKIGYLALNIAIYTTHTYSTFFFSKKLELLICDYGYIGCLSVFYMTNILVGPLIDKYRITKRTAMFGIVASTCVYSLFLIAKNTCKNIWIMGCVFGMYLVLLSPVFSLFDVLVLNHISKVYSEKSVVERKEVFSRIRMWASFGHAFAGPMIAYITWLFSEKNLGQHGKEAIAANGFTMLISILFVSAAIFVAIVYFSVEEMQKSKQEVGVKEKLADSSETISAQKNASAKEEKVASSRSLLLNPEFLFFLFVITSIGVTRGVSSYYLVSYMNTYFEVNFSKISSIMCLRTISEMGIFYYSKYLLKYFGYHWLLLFSLIGATLREFNYAHMPNSRLTIIYAVLNEMFKGISSACLIFSSVNIADSLAGKENKAFSQMCCSGCYNGASLLVSSLLSIGAIRAFEDFRSLFLCSSLFGLVCSIIIVIKYGIIDRHLGPLKSNTHL